MWISLMFMSAFAANEGADEYARLALDAAVAGELSHAAVFARHALRSDPGDADVQMAVGVLHWTRTAELSADLQHAAQADPSRESPAFLEVLREYTHEACKAVTAFKRSIAVNPWDSAAAWALQGVVRGVLAQGPPAAPAAAAVASVVVLRDYVGGPHRHATHRTRLVEATAMHDDESTPPPLIWMQGCLVSPPCQDRLPQMPSCCGIWDTSSVLCECCAPMKA